MATSPRFRPGHQDSRERYSGRINLLIVKDADERERFVVMTFDPFGMPTAAWERYTLEDAITVYDREDAILMAQPVI